MKYTLRYTGEFKRSLKHCLKRGYDEQLLTDVLDILVTEGRLPEGFSGDTLTYKDLESGTTFTLNLNTGKKVQ